MATTDELLQAHVQKLHIQQTDFPDCFPSLNPVDVYRIHLANSLSNVTGVAAKTLYPLLQRATTLEKGDLLLPVPALKIKGEKPDALASRWVDRVISFIKL